MGKITILDETTKDPIILIGRAAGYTTRRDVIDAAKCYARGKECIESMHGRALELPTVLMTLEGYSARVIREWYTHIGCLPTRLQESTRYIKEGGFRHVTPPNIAGSADAGIIYNNIMDDIRTAYNKLIDLGIPTEDAAMILPLGMETKIIDKRNLRNLIDMSHQRLCSRAYWEYRNLMADVCAALSAYSPEWKELVDTQFKPKCEMLGYCPESKSCGRTPRKP